MRGSRNRVTTEQRDDVVGVDEAHRRFGGVHLGAVLAGAFTGVGLVVGIDTIVAAATQVHYLDGRSGVAQPPLSSVIVGIAILAASLLAGGWVAGRTARYDGARNGGLAAVAFVALAGISALLGIALNEKYNVFAGNHLPQWFNHHVTTTPSLVSAVVAVAAMLVLATIGGKIGDRYHHRVDAVIAANRDGGIGVQSPIAPIVLDDDTAGARSALHSDTTVVAPAEAGATRIGEPATVGTSRVSREDR